MNPFRPFRGPVPDEPFAAGLHEAVKNTLLGLDMTLAGREVICRTVLTLVQELAAGVQPTAAQLADYAAALELDLARMAAYRAALHESLISGRPLDLSKVPHVE